MTTSIRFEALIERYHDEIYRYLWRLLRDDADAEDMAQEVFLRAYRAFPRLRAESNHRAWLYRIATNGAYTLLKRRQREADHCAPLLDEALPASEQSPEAQVAIQEARAAIRAALQALPPKQRAAVIMRHLQELDYAEIAAVLGCSEESARANVYQGLRHLRRGLGRGEQGG